MKKTLLTILLILTVSTIGAQIKEKPNSRIGLAVDGGMAHAFIGKDLNPFNTYAKPYWGWFAGGELLYEMEYRHFLFRLGFGTQYSVYQNTFDYPEQSRAISEYNTMLYHYKFKNYREKTSSGHCYVPIMVGAEFNCFYFLLGTKLGFLPYQTYTQSVVDTHIWATDEDIINPLEGLYTHNMGDFTFTGEKHSIMFNDFSASASLELGVCLGKRPSKINSNSSTEEIYKELHRHKSFGECARYKIALFADYGLTDLINHEANAELYKTSEAIQSADGLIEIPETGKVVPHSLLLYKPHQNAMLHNLYVGVRFSILYEIPHAAPTKGPYAHPHLVTYTRNKFTGEILRKSRITMYSINRKTKINESIILKCDKETGIVENVCPAGTYTFRASCPDYLPAEVSDYAHGERFDTLYIDMLPKLKVSVKVVDALTQRPISASLRVYVQDEPEKISNHSVFSGQETVVPLEYNQTYSICASSEGYHDTCAFVLSIDTALTISMATKQVRKFILRNLYFATDQTKVLPSSEEALMRLFVFLIQNPGVNIKIIGHTDDVASDEYNQKLSEGRANSIKDEMVKRGIDSSRIETEGRGESDPIVPNTSDKNRQENRRVEIEIITGSVNIEHIRGFFEL